MSESEQSGAGRREVAYRLFAAEFEAADFSYSESDEERAPNYVITPTGARVNRLFVVGVLTEIEEVSEDVLRARVVDPTGAFVLYAGQYQPDEQAFLDSADTPTFVAVTGKARTFQPDDSDRVFTSVRPESISEVDAATRDRWTVQTAEQTLQRVGHAATALSLDVRGDDLRATLEDHGVDEGLAAGIPLAIDHYGTTPAYLDALRVLALDAARLVAGELDEVEGLAVAPDESGDADLADLADTEVEPAVSADDVATAAETSSASDDATTVADVSEATADPSQADATSSETTESASEPTTETTTADTSETETAEPPTETVTTDSSSESTDSSAVSAERGDETSESSTAEPATTDESDTVAAAATSGDAVESEPAATGDATTGDATPDGATDEDDIGDFEPGEFELDEEEREEIEEEYGTEFQTGSEVPEPGEADIETPDPDEIEEAPAEDSEVQQPNPTTSGEQAGVEPSEPDGIEASEPESETTGETAASDSATETEPEEPAVEDEPTAAADEGEEEPADVVDLEDAVVDAMEDLDDGDGVDREELVAAVTDRHGADPDAVEDAIQDALMDGRCYEPDDGTLKPI